jgi:hypothetical protein
VEEGAKQPIAVPNGQEGGCTQMQGAVVEVEVEAGPYAAYEHDGECDNEQGCQESDDSVYSVEQQFGPFEGCWEESVPWGKKNCQMILNQLKN